MLFSTSGFVQKPVGVQTFPATNTHPPLRVFYPCSPNTGSFSWLAENGVPYYLQGFIRMGSKSSLLLPFIYLISFLIPVRWRRLPSVFPNAPPITATTKRPAIVFSHGLTGTGQEHALLLATWASLGYTVVSVHHTDGSSSRVRLADGSHLDYDPGPSYQNYDANFRPRQIEQRATEIAQACAFCESQWGVPLHWTVAGFSYGAATAARVLSQRSWAAAVFLDGWFYIDVSQTAQVEFPFPKQAFVDGALSQLPCVFVNSEEFANYPKLFRATKQHAKGHPLHVIQGTGHQNFCDVIFWMPQFLLKRILGRALGPRDPLEAYREIVDITTQFLVRNLSKKNT